ncbi:hypothetical protein niasHT_014574 [Heterodera trifolii]|uniref:Ubiquitin-like protease family profile domain-containing protein n=1 Tax=Heterodera trifolii TaxID=157864 RepID=A0ABD2LJB7_9BILA
MSVIKKIDKDSVEGLEGSLSLFSLPPTNVAINKTNVRELLPLSALNQTGEWVALSDTDANDKHVGVIQNFGSSFVRSLKVNISGIEEIRKAFHEASCYYPDDDDQNSATNPGFTARAARFSGSKQCETMVKLNFDLARQNALMLNNQDVIFTIHRNNDSFLLLTPPYKKPDGTLQENKKEYRIRVHDMRLYVRTVDVTPSLNLAISRQLESTSAKYPLRKIEMRSIFLGTGRTELAHNVFTSTLPRRLICTFVSTDAYSGNRKTSPYKFEHANVRSISVEANGQTFPSTPYLLSFDGAQPRFVRAFVDMYAGLGLDDSDTKTVSIGMQRFLNAQLEIILKKLRPTKNKFIGVFPSDRIPKRVSKFPHCMVVNTGKEGTRGEHWVACYASSHRRVEYFDSLGEQPNPDLASYLNTFKEVLVTKDQIQLPTSDTCGHFCIYFLTSRCSGVPYCHVIDTLRKTRSMADYLVKCCVPLLLHSELINVDLTVDNQNYFDSGKYRTFSKDATAQHASEFDQMGKRQ